MNLQSPRSFQPGFAAPNRQEGPEPEAQAGALRSEGLRRSTQVACTASRDVRSLEFMGHDPKKTTGIVTVPTLETPGRSFWGWVVPTFVPDVLCPGAMTHRNLSVNFLKTLFDAS